MLAVVQTLQLPAFLKTTAVMIGGTGYRLVSGIVVLAKSVSAGLYRKVSSEQV